VKVQSKKSFASLFKGCGVHGAEPLPDSKGSAFGRLRSKRNDPEKSLGKG